MGLADSQNVQSNTSIGTKSLQHWFGDASISGVLGESPFMQGAPVLTTAKNCCHVLGLAARSSVTMKLLARKF